MKELLKATKAIDGMPLVPCHDAVAFYDPPGSTNLMNDQRKATCSLNQPSPRTCSSANLMNDQRKATLVMLLHIAMCCAIIKPNGALSEIGGGLLEACSRPPCRPALPRSEPPPAARPPRRPAGTGGGGRPARAAAKGPGGLRSPGLAVRSRPHCPDCATSPPGTNLTG